MMNFWTVKVIRYVTIFFVIAFFIDDYLIFYSKKEILNDNFNNLINKKIIFKYLNDNNFILNIKRNFLELLSINTYKPYIIYIIKFIKLENCYNIKFEGKISYVLINSINNINSILIYEFIIYFLYYIVYLMIYFFLKFNPKLINFIKYIIIYVKSFFIYLYILMEYLLNLFNFVLIKITNNKKLINIKHFILIYIFLFIIIYILIFLNIFPSFHLKVFFNYNVFNNKKIPLNENLWEQIINFNLIEGLSLTFIFLTLIIYLVIILASLKIKINHEKEFFLLLHIIVFICILSFSVNNILIFFVLFESSLIPLFLIIGKCGHGDFKIKASFYLIIYTSFFSIPMLISVLMNYYYQKTFNVYNLHNSSLNKNSQLMVFIFFIIAFLVKLPIIPLHLWLPRAHVEAPMAISCILAAILLKIGGYGLLKFCHLWPESIIFFKPILLIIGSLSMLIASWCAIRQSDAKRLIAYSSISHMGLVFVCFSINSLISNIGCILVMISHGFISCSFFIAIGILYERSHSKTITLYKGLTIIHPIFGTFLFILSLSNIGFPLTFNFVGELLCIISVSNTSIF